MLAVAEAVLFAAAEPIEHTRLSIVLGTDSETTLEILDILKERYEKELDDIYSVLLYHYPRKSYLFH